MRHVSTRPRGFLYNNTMAGKNGYHHGNLKETLLNIGMKSLEEHGAENLSLRQLAELAGVSKNAPYRHFPTKDLFLGELVSRGYKTLYELLEKCIPGQGTVKNSSGLSEFGKGVIRFACSQPALYRLMNSELICRMPDEQMVWPRKTLELLSSRLTGREGFKGYDATVAAWAYMHGLAMLKIDNLFPALDPEPDWNALAGAVGSFFTI